MSDDDVDVANAGGDQDYGQNVHWHAASGVVADLVGDCERRRRQHEMGQDPHPALGEHEISKNREYEANDGDEIVYGIHFGVQLSRPTVIVTSADVQRSIVNRKS